MDPRVAQTGVYEEAVRTQYGFRLAVQDLLSEARQKAADLHKEREDLDESSARASAIDGALAALETEDGTYMQPRLIDQTRFLLDMLSHADQLPGGHAEERLEELKSEYAAILESL